MDIKQRFIEVLEEDVAMWEKAAANCEFLRNYVTEGQKQQMVSSAETYRARANSLRALLKLLKESN